MEAAFVLSSPTPTCRAQANTTTCGIKAATKIFALPAASLLLSASLLLPLNTLADDAPLVFDHDQSLAGADFSKRADLRRAIFSKSNCKGANFSGSDLTAAQLDDGNVWNPNSVLKNRDALLKISNHIDVY